MMVATAFLSSSYLLFGFHKYQSSSSTVLAAGLSSSVFQKARTPKTTLTKKIEDSSLLAQKMMVSSSTSDDGYNHHDNADGNKGEGSSKLIRVSSESSSSSPDTTEDKQGLSSSSSALEEKQNDHKNEEEESPLSNGETKKKNNKKNTTEGSSSSSNNNNNNNKSKNVASDREYGGGDDSNLIYKSGIPTLRSSAHRVKFNIKSRKHDPKPIDKMTGKETKTTWLPNLLLKEDVFQFDIQKYDLRQAVISLLDSCDTNIVGSFKEEDEEDQQQNEDNNNENENDVVVSRRRLEDFCIPVPSIWRSVNGGNCESAQKYLSDQVASNEQFLQLFDQFVLEVVLPYVKQRLIEATTTTAASSSSSSVANVDNNNDKTSDECGPSRSYTFYYQRPPTLRIQPGPGWAKVKPHNDAEYGHQNGELNIWVPLTRRDVTKVDLYSETNPGKLDYHPIPANVGEAISFHGSSCKHYVNANTTPYSRVSLDFRIGVSGYFDPYWQMKGTTHDHGRKEITL